MTRPTIAALDLARGVNGGQMSLLIDAFRAVGVASGATEGTLICAALHLAAELAPGKETGLVDLMRYVAARRRRRSSTR